jgi:ABC-type Fe3+ transport system permease subunit
VAIALVERGFSSATRPAAASRSAASYAVQRLAGDVGLAIVGLVVLAWTLLPIYHMVFLSFTPVSEAFGGRYWPDHPTLENYRIVVMQDHFYLRNIWRQLLNSMMVAVGTMALVLAIASMASFAIGRLRLRYGHLVSNTALLTYLIPQAFLAIPFYKVMSEYGLLNTHLALIFAMSTFAIPYAIWVLRQYAETIPFELDEAAKVDGGTPLQIFCPHRHRHLRPAAGVERVPLRLPPPLGRDRAHRPGGDGLLPRQRRRAMADPDGHRDHLRPAADGALLRRAALHGLGPALGRHEGLSAPRSRIGAPR